MNVRPASWTLALLAGCSFGDDPAHWTDQLSPSGPCWEINLVDGLDESSTQELHDLYACLNRDGNLDSLAEFDAAMDDPGRSGSPVGLTVAKLTNALPTSGYDLLGSAGKILQVLDQYQEDADIVLETIVEAIYGQPFGDIDETDSLGTAEDLSAGVMVPAIHLLSTTASLLLDEESAGHDEIITLMDSDTLSSAICTATGVITTTDPVLSPLGDEIMAHLGRAWVRAKNSGNDRWDNASGNSIRDAIHSLRIGDDDGPITKLEPIITTLLGDEEVQRNTRFVLSQAADDGDLVHLATQLQHLADVDRSGIPLSSPSASGISALQAGARLLHTANTDVECSIDLPIISDLEFSLGNLSVSILRRLAELDEGSAVDSVGILGDVVGYSLTQTILGAIIDTGICPVFTDELLDDLEVLERLNDPAVGNLVAVFHGLLDGVYVEGETDRLQEVVDLLSVVHAEGLLPPIEELLRDLASSELSADATVILQTLIDPTPLNTDSCPADSTPLTFDSVWTTAADGLSDSGGSALFGRISQTIVEDEDLWQLIDNGAELTAHDTSRVHELPRLVVELVIGDEDELGRSLVEEFVADEALWTASLELVELNSVRDALVRPSGDTAGPLPFIASLVLSDTVTVMLQTVDLLLDSLGTEDSTQP